MRTKRGGGPSLMALHFVAMASGCMLKLRKSVIGLSFHKC